MMSTSSAPGSPAKRQPAAERVYAHVKRAVLDRSYEGGTLLTEGGVAEAVGVSRTPVREGLLRLEAEGLIKLYPKKGALVLPVSAQEIADVVETRLLIEEHAVRKVLPAGEALLERLGELLRAHADHLGAGDLARAADSDRAFHAEIVRAAGNAILAHLYDQLRDRQLRMGVQILHADPRRIARNVEEHTEILNALRGGDAEAAIAVVRRHAGRVRAIVRGEEP